MEVVPFTRHFATPDEQLWFGILRLGVWLDLYPGVQVARDDESLNQFFRQMVGAEGDLHDSSLESPPIRFVSTVS
jgi:hypothetical protein